MSVNRCEPNRSVIPFSSAMTSVFDEFMPGFMRHWDIPTVAIRPAVDVVEEENQVTVKADMPGLDKGDVKVVVHDGLLSIEGSRKEVRDEKQKGVTRSERFIGTFSRSFNLPPWADSSKITANYKNGVLEVVIPKTETARPKEIEIKIS
ncbi:MAG: Hsp20/alpha crystallin family protein [candidate division Zixibacteria bacterium]|nr:Hsp20/alpha crystallin family protein [candidate division Zixibacteria bacterium]